MAQQNSSATEANDRIYKKELFVVVASSIICMLCSMGVLFMLPFPGLLKVYIWGFPFPYWYQMTVAYVGIVAFIYWIVLVMTKLDDAKAKAEREV
jgi:putative solute:sodium symporter small subunit